MSELSLLGLAALFTGIVGEVEQTKHDALERAAVVIETEAKRAIGTYDYAWPKLADPTQAERVRLGFSANEPGLRTGEMRDSIEHTVHADRGEAYIGSDNDDLFWFELGTITQPPRPVLSGAAAHKGKDVAEIIGKRVIALMLGERTIGSVLQR